MSDDMENEPAAIAELKIQIRKLRRENTAIKSAMALADAFSQTQSRFYSILQKEKLIQEKYLNMLLKNSISIIILLDRNGCIVYCTDEFLKTFEINSVEAVKGIYFSDIVNISNYKFNSLHQVV
jgi:PAS domain-containing protein